MSLLLLVYLKWYPIFLPCNVIFVYVCLWCNTYNEKLYLVLCCRTLNSSGLQYLAVGWGPWPTYCGMKSDNYITTPIIGVFVISHAYVCTWMNISMWCEWMVGNLHVYMSTATQSLAKYFIYIVTCAGIFAILIFM